MSVFPGFSSQSREVEYMEQLLDKDSSFVSAIPGDVIDIDDLLCQEEYYEHDLSDLEFDDIMCENDLSVVGEKFESSLLAEEGYVQVNKDEMECESSEVISLWDNPGEFYCSDVFDSIHELLQTEQSQGINANYLEQVQTSFKPWMRNQVIHWMHAVVSEMSLRFETYTASVLNFDRFMSSMEVSPKSAQLVAAGCILIGAKLYEEYPPLIRRLIEFTDNAYSQEEVCQIEMLIMQKLEWRSRAITPQVFLYLFQGIHQWVTPKLVEISTELLTSVFGDSRLLKFRPSILAFSCIHLVCELCSHSPDEMEVLVEVGECFFVQDRECVDECRSILFHQIEEGRVPKFGECD